MKLFILCFTFMFTLSAFSMVRSKDGNENIRAYLSKGNNGEDLVSLVACLKDGHSNYHCFTLGQKKFYSAHEIDLATIKLSQHLVDRARNIGVSVFGLATAAAYAAWGITSNFNFGDMNGTTQAVVGGIVVMGLLTPKFIYDAVEDKVVTILDISSSDETVLSSKKLGKLAAALDNALDSL